MNTNNITSNEGRCGNMSNTTIKTDFLNALPPRALTKKEFAVFYPASIDVEDLKEKLHTYRYNLEIDKVLSFITMVALYSIRYDKEAKGNFLTKARIHSKTLKVVFKGRYLEYYKFLFECGILTKRAPYDPLVFGKTFGYGFTSQHQKKRFKITVITCPGVVEIEDLKLSPCTKKYDKIFWSKFDRTKFALDFCEVESLLNEKYLTDSKNHLAYHAAIKQMVKLMNGIHSFSRDTLGLKKETRTTGRLYSPISTLNKIVRNALFYEDIKLAQLDVSNMFPYLLSQYLPEVALIDNKRTERLMSCAAFKNKYPSLFSNQYHGNASKDWLEKSTLLFNKRDRFTASSNRVGEFLQAALLPSENNLKSCRSQAPFRRTWGVISNKFSPITENTFRLSNSHLVTHYTSVKFDFKVEDDYWLKHLSLGKYKLFSRVNFIEKKVKLKDKSSVYLSTLKDYKKAILQNFSNVFDNVCVGFPKSKVSSLNYISHEFLQTIMNKEIDEFKELCVNGRIYDFMISSIKGSYTDAMWDHLYHSEINETYKDEYIQDRNFTKKLFIAMLYANNSSRKEEQSAFKKKFPIIFDVIFEIKKRDYKAITYHLFELEANIIVDNIARNLIKTYRIPVFTIHDCIAIQEIHVELARSKMKEEFKSRFGDVPVIKLES